MEETQRGGFAVGDVVLVRGEPMQVLPVGGGEFRLVHPNGYMPNEFPPPNEWEHVATGIKTPFDFEPLQIVHDFEGEIGLVTKCRDGVLSVNAKVDHICHPMGLREGEPESITDWGRWSPVFSVFGFTVKMTAREPSRMPWESDRLEEEE